MTRHALSTPKFPTPRGTLPLFRRTAAPLVLAVRATATLVMVGCTTAGSAWMAQPLPNDDFDEEFERAAAATTAPSAPRGSRPPRTRVLGQSATSGDTAPPQGLPAGASIGPGGGAKAAGGKSLGTFRNTYYDFPSESEFDGPTVRLRNASCEVIREVPRGFFETLCVQGSGTLRTGPTVSFAKRDCACAELCPRTQQKICFDVLDPATFPWGRGATGKAITPLLTVAVDTNVIPMGTAVYVPELDGLPRDLEGTSVHDGCFVAQDRGVKVVGKHLDVFTGHSAVTTLWNKLVPSNRGVTVILDSPRCRRSD